jgi:hypothetical protein
MGESQLPKRQFKLTEELQQTAAIHDDPIIKTVQQTLDEFAYSEIIPRRLEWKYLPDSAFIERYLEQLKASGDVYPVNHALLSHLLRVIEAFEIVSIWRATDLIDPCVKALNDENFVAAAVLARSLVELTVRYGDAANRLRAHFETFNWEGMRTHVMLMDQTNETSGKKDGLESFVERLMGGTRLDDVVKANPDMAMQNILTTIEKTDKALAKQGMGYQIKPHYERLCELAHPNAVGFHRYVHAEQTRLDGWISRTMMDRARGIPSVQILCECLWALSWAAGSINGLFGVFQTWRREIHPHVKPLLPR